MLTQPQGKLIEALQLGDEGADGAPGPLLQPQVPGILDGLGKEHQQLPQATVSGWVGGRRALGVAPTSRISCPAPVYDCSSARIACASSSTAFTWFHTAVSASVGCASAGQRPGEAGGRETRRALSEVLGGKSRSGVPAPRPAALPPARSPSWRVSPPGPSPCPSLSQATGLGWGGAGKGESWLPCDRGPAHRGPRAAPSPGLAPTGCKLPRGRGAER